MTIDGARADTEAHRLEPLFGVYISPPDGVSGGAFFDVDNGIALAKADSPSV